MKKLEQINKILNDINAKDIKTFDYERKSPFFDYVFLATVNQRQSNGVLSHLKDENLIENLSVEGKNTGWTLVDLGDTLIHLFNEEYRSYYNFDEKLLGYKEITFK